MVGPAALNRSVKVRFLPPEPVPALVGLMAEPQAFNPADVGSIPAEGARKGKMT